MPNRKETRTRSTVYPFKESTQSKRKSIKDEMTRALDITENEDLFMIQNDDKASDFDNLLKPRIEQNSMRDSRISDPNQITRFQATWGRSTKG